MLGQGWLRYGHNPKVEAGMAKAAEERRLESSQSVVPAFRAARPKTTAHLKDGLGDTVGQTQNFFGHRALVAPDVAFSGHSL